MNGLEILTATAKTKTATIDFMLTAIVIWLIFVQIECILHNVQKLNDDFVLGQQHYIYENPVDGSP